MRKIVILALLITLSVANARVITYFSGIGCPHCAKTDPFLFKKLINTTNLIVIDYEVYREPINAQLLSYYCNKYQINCGIPIVFINETKIIIGDEQIINELMKYDDNKIILPNKTISINELNINELPAKPKIWYNNSVLIRLNDGWLLEWNGELQKPIWLNGSYEETTPQPVQLSGTEVIFNNAAIIRTTTTTQVTNKLTLLKVLSLAIVDAVNPCALSVLTLMLMTIASLNNKKKVILLSGLSFSLAVLIMYFFYGLILVKIFKTITALTNAQIIIYKSVGAIGLILGLIQLINSIKYKPGVITTEMPLRLRPKVKKIINKTSSPRGAFIIGLLVTVFLLPCTIGPYVVTTGLLTNQSIIKAIIYLVIYNIVFISPMIMISIIVYLGVSKITSIKKWRKQKVRLLHFIEGIIMTILGLSILLGLI